MHHVSINITLYISNINIMGGNQIARGDTTMSSFKIEEKKLDNIQIVMHLSEHMTHEQKMVLGHATMRIRDKNISESDRAILVHGIIDCYSKMGDTTDAHVMEMRKAMKVLVTKFMNGSADREGERSACRSLMTMCWKILEEDGEK